MTRDELAQDLAYARNLAEEGRHAPLLGGSHLVFWGVLNLVAYVGQWSLITGTVPSFGGAAFAVLWLGFGGVASLGSILLGQRVRDKPGAGAIGVQAERALWRGVALAIGAIAVGSILRMFVSHDLTAPNVIMGAAFALFGAALAGTAMLARRAWLAQIGALAFLTAIVLCAFANEPWAYLLAAAACVPVLIVPGAVLMKHEPPAAD